jgi:hypothetical protein
LRRLDLRAGRAGVAFIPEPPTARVFTTHALCTCLDGRRQFQCSLALADLLSLARMELLAPWQQTKQGSQAALERAEFALDLDFILLAEQTVPASPILASARVPLSFSATVSDDVGELAFDSQTQLWVLERREQLRALGEAWFVLGREDLATLPIPVVILEALTLEEETDLYLRDRERGRTYKVWRDNGLRSMLPSNHPARLPTPGAHGGWEERAWQLTRILQGIQPLAGRIRARWDSKVRAGTVGQRVFALALKPLLLHPTFQLLSGEEQAQFLENLWLVVRDLGRAQDPPVDLPSRGLARFICNIHRKGLAVVDDYLSDLGLAYEAVRGLVEEQGGYEWLIDV